MAPNITDNNMGSETFPGYLGSSVNSSSTQTNNILKPEVSDTEKSRRSSEQSRGRKSTELLVPETDDRRRSPSFDKHRPSAVERDLAMNSKANVPKKHQSIKDKVFANKLVPSFLE